MRYSLLVLGISLLFLSKANAQTIPGTTLALTTQQYNLTQASPDLYFTATLVNPPTDVNGNLPQSVRLKLLVHFPSNPGAKSFNLIASNLWNNSSIWSPTTFSSFSNQISVNSTALPVYYNSLATANFLASIPSSIGCTDDTIWYELQVRYYADTNATIQMSWQNNGIADSVAESQLVGITKISTVPLPNSSPYNICVNDTACFSLTNFQTGTGPLVDSVKVVVNPPAGSSFIAFKNNFGSVLSTSTTYTSIGSGAGLKSCIYFPTGYTGSGSHVYNYTVYACGQAYSFAETYTVTVSSCTTSTVVPPPVKSCNVTSALACLQAAVCTSNLSYYFSKSDTTSFGYFDVIMTLPIKLQASSLAVPSNLVGSAYTITATTTNCTSLTGTFTSTSLSLLSLYTCGSTALQMQVRITDSIKSFNYVFGVLATYDSAFTNYTLLQSTINIKDTSGAVILSKTISPSAMYCGTSASNAFIVGTNTTISTVMANPGALVPAILTFYSTGVPNWMAASGVSRIAIKAPNNWTFDILAGVGEKKAPSPNMHIAQNTNPFGTASNYFVQQGTMQMPYTTSTSANWLYIDSVKPSGNCNLYNVFTSAFYYTVRVPFGTAAGTYFLDAYLQSSNGTVLYNVLPIKIIVAPYAQVYASTKAKCFDNTFFAERSIVNDTSTALRFIGEIINTGNVPLKNISIFNSEPKFANGSLQDVQYSNCNYNIRGSDFDCINYGLHTSTPVSTIPIWTSATNYTHLNPLNLDTLPYSNVTPIGATNFIIACNNTTTASGGLGNGSIMLNAASNFTLQPRDRISFYTNAMAHNGAPGDTVFNSFTYVCTRADNNSPMPIVSSSKCTTAVVNSGIGACPACEYVTLTLGCKNKPTLTVHNISSLDVSKIAFAFTGPCIVGTYTVDYTLYNLLAPGQSITIPANLLPSITLPCSVSVSTTLYTQTIAGSNQILDECTSGLIVTTNFPDTLSQMIIKPPIVCYGRSTTVTVNGNGTIPPYLYSINGSVFDTINVFTGITAGTYTTTVQDSLGCVDSVVFTLTQPDTLFINSLVTQDLLCNGDSSGSFIISISGGLPWYFTSIQPGSINLGFDTSYNDLAAATYTVVSSDALGCSVSVSFTITQPTQLEHHISTTLVTCAYGNDGSICDTVAGGVPPYLYSINNSSYDSVYCFSQLAVDTYTIVVKDANNCTASTIVDLTSIASPLIFGDVQVRQANCGHDSSGYINLHVQGGTIISTSQHYSFNITGTNTAYQVIVGSDSIYLSKIKAGSYTIVAADANGCTVSTEIAIANIGVFDFDAIQITDALCYGTTTGLVEATTVGGFAPLNYSLASTNINNTDGNFQGLAAGAYTLLVTDSLGCTIDSIITIEQPTAMFFNQLDIRYVSCEGYNDGAIFSAVLGGSGNYLYELQPTNSSNYSGDFLYLGVNTYSLNVTDKNGCVIDSSFNLDLASPALQIATEVQHISSCTGPTSLGTATLQFNGTGNVPITVVWNSSPPQYDSIATNLPKGTYVALAIDAKGCSASTTVEIVDSLDCCGDAILPSAFTPNMDMLNDQFGLMNSSELSINLEAFEIFDRWGKCIFSTSVFGEKWDGTYKGELVELGTYWYYYRYTCSKDSKRYVVKGDVLVAR
ncbi:MAG: hypothetical protein RL660_1171 [Bacteroidota bacterium]|jgi:gliding motility-associated-like protein